MRVSSLQQSDSEGFDELRGDFLSQLVRAIDHKQFELASRILKSKKLDLNSTDISGNTALIKAIWTRNIKLIEKLIEKGADVNYSDGYDSVPLIDAVLAGNNVEVVEMLLEKGADVNSSNSFGETALIETIKILLKKGEGEVKKEKAVKIIEKLLEKGADINLKYRGETALVLAAKSGNVQLVQLLANKSGVK